MNRWLALGAPTYTLEREQLIPRGIDEVFKFFEDPQNLPRITPTWLDFKILSSTPGRVQKGSEIVYSLRWFGVHYRWKTLIESWEQNRNFVDTQLRGPYILWHHSHHFETVDGGVKMRDVVRYRLPFGPGGMLAHAIVVRRQLNHIFDYRREKVAEVFGA